MNQASKSHNTRPTPTVDTEALTGVLAAEGLGVHADALIHAGVSLKLLLSKNVTADSLSKNTGIPWAAAVGVLDAAQAWVAQRGGLLD